jgi:mRNA-degrading endonuclease toxin of MazEF toxin-antitoxin module
VIPVAGELWSADRGDEQRRLVLVVSDRRFHRLAGRAVVVPVVPEPPEVAGPWYVPLDDGRAVAVHLLATLTVDRLLESVGSVHFAALSRVRRVMHLITQ